MQETNNIKLIIPDCFEHYNLTSGITTRKGGVSKNGYESFNMGFNSGDNPDDVISNRQILASQLNTSVENFVFANQVHDANIEIITEKEKGKGLYSPQDAIQNTDGMITDKKNIFLTIQTADCLSIFLYCPKKKVIALLHAGWKSLHKKIIEKCVNIFKQKYNSNPKDLIVYLGPSISAESYEVGEEFKNYFPYCVIERENKLFFNLKKASIYDLLSNEISIKNIYTDEFCTYKQNDLFYSYRRDGAHTGRILSFFCITF